MQFMDKEKYKLEVKKLKAKHTLALHALNKQYIESNAVCEIGDFITDHIGTILVEKIKWSVSLGSNIPVALYYGLCYTKAGKPFKSGEKRNVWGPNIEGGL